MSPPGRRIHASEGESLSAEREGSPVINTGQVTASVVSHRQGALLAGLLEDLARVAPPQLAHLVITLNLPEDEPRLPALPFRVTVLRNAVPLGFGANHNAAFAHGASEWFWILNPDLRLPVDPLPALLTAARPTDAILAPQVIEAGRVADAARLLPTPARLVRRRLLGQRQLAEEQGGRYDWLAGMCVLVRSAAFRSLGGFDERYRMYCEDVDLSLRAQLAGGTLQQVAGARVQHESQRASRRSLRYLAWHVRSLLRLWGSAAYRQYRRRERA